MIVVATTSLWALGVYIVFRAMLISNSSCHLRKCSRGRVRVVRLALWTATVGFLVSISFPLKAQPTAALAFEAASVKLAPLPSDGHFTLGYRFTESGFVGNHLDMRQCVEAAYNVPSASRIVGPDWIRSSSFTYDILAKAMGPVSKGDLRLMLQTLLADRFDLKLHIEEVEAPVYALIRNGKSLRLIPSQSDGPDDDSATRPTPGGIELRHASMRSLANVLSGQFVRLDRPVIDMTQTDGLFDIKLSYATKGPGMPDLDPPIENNMPSIFTAIQELGLKLEARRGTVRQFVVDHANRTPIEN
jgi:uncharacterized protein (TIGR03435 family)